MVRTEREKEVRLEALWILDNLQQEVVPVKSDHYCKMILR